MSRVSDPNAIPEKLIEREPIGWPSGWRDEQLGEPVLVLATRLNRRPKSTPPWHVIQHQTGGILCTQHRMWAMRLTPTPDIHTRMARLEAHWFESNAGWNLSLDELSDYRSSLREIMGPEFDCNLSFSNFGEAIYPIDCSRHLLSRICTDELPELFGDFFDDEFSRPQLYSLQDYLHAELYVLGANLD